MRQAVQIFVNAVFFVASVIVTFWIPKPFFDVRFLLRTTTIEDQWITKQFWNSFFSCNLVYPNKIQMRTNFFTEMEFEFKTHDGHNQICCSMPTPQTQFRWWLVIRSSNNLQMLVYLSINEGTSLLKLPLYLKHHYNHNENIDCVCL